ncbi:U3 small nucleolar ribonucleoprotein protein MPP10 [Phymastichus coffea]|uniref:U3 small nucleolar ribonucleoprotein protein MPP10 n=1 Tax=Phymastichus coffea TaxID=108790 RepID=UPI00273AD683|nr:U3 small nucleolar ribonucleoprotein protein MPP10 [Phymastichus coffea]
MQKNELSLLEKVHQTIQHCTKKPEHYLSIQENVADDLKKITKRLYDLVFKKKSSTYTNTKALPELIIEDFDTEQIWQQLELENNEEFSRTSIKNFSKVLACKNWDLPLKIVALLGNENSKKVQSESEISKYEDKNEVELLDNVSEENLSKEISCKKLKRKKKSNEVDDKFFKIEELNRFLKMEDQRERGIRQEVDSEQEELESIDLFNNISDFEDEIAENDDIKNAQLFKYADFFDSPESSDDEQNTSENNMVIVGFNDNSLENDKDTSDDDTVFRNSKLFYESDSSNEGSHEKMQSSLEKRKERLEKRIYQLEHQAVSDKPWQLKGEVSSKDRPMNSLLEEYVEFDQVTRPAPAMTEQTTMKLEDIIRTRIKDKAWDDVEKKVKPVETPMEYKKKLIMNQEKSKESLAQIYENEYIKQREALTSDDKALTSDDKVEEPSEYNEIRELMHSLFMKLDALSNFHYTPKPAKPEIKIVSNVPAINMEEVAPLATSEAALLAPEEIQSKQMGDLIGKSERTKTDMKRARRKKKLKQLTQAINESKKSVDNFKQRKSLNNKIKQLKGRNIINMNDSVAGKAIKSSTAFFSQLQDQVSSNINTKISTSKKKKKNLLSAVKLKL